jgi:hypothetical protein
MASSSVKSKQYPEEYDPDAVKILELMKLPNSQMNLYGSMTIPSQLYPGDYDSICFVNYKKLSTAVRDFQLRVRILAETPDIFIGDMKIGILPEYDIWKNSKIQLIDNTLKVVDFDKSYTLDKLSFIHRQKIIDTQEYEHYQKIIHQWKDTPDPKEYAKVLKDLRPHILRWTLKEVLQGFKILPNNQTITLSNALQSKGVVKVDIIGLTNGKSKFTDFSMIYDIRINNKVITYDVKTQDVVNELRLSVYENSLLGNYFKAIKRIFSLARYFRNMELVKRLTDYLNGFIGLIYQVKSDIGTLLYLEENYENLPVEKIQYELKMFRVRLTSFNETYQNKKINHIINELLESKDKPKTIHYYKELEKSISDIVNNNGKKELLEIYPKVIVD